ncbi:MAG: hypothetical protein WBF93_20455 [Pirellulales bacterium]
MTVPKLILQLVVMLVVFAWDAGCVTSSAFGEEPPSLKDTLENGLRARRPEEFAFIGTVVELVEQGTLPRRLVESTFMWAQRQHALPFPYFELGLRTRAKRIGISL